MLPDLVPVKRPNQISVSFAPRVRREIEAIVASGEYLTETELIRRAVDDLLEKRREKKQPPVV